MKKPWPIATVLLCLVLTLSGCPPVIYYAVSYNGNGASGGSAPTDTNSPYTSVEMVIVLDNTGDLVKTGHTFSGWNTQPNGSGLHHNPGDSFKMPANNLTLYAEWKSAAPNRVANPNPADAATGVSVTADLSWADGGGATSYDVYFGTVSSPSSGHFQGNQGGTSFNLGTLAYSTTYYWRIDSKNSTGTTTGTVWHFTTEGTPPSAPNPAISPNPSNGATSVSVTADLSWSNGGGATSYDVYFGNDSTPDSGESQGNQGGTSFNLGTLAYSTTYYWRIDSKNSTGTTTGTVWHFTTQTAAPNPAISPNPSNGATNVSVNANVSWANGGGATNYDVYFGNDSTPDGGEFQANETGTWFGPGLLSYSTTYYWRIDAKNSAGTTTGSVWYFTTEADPVHVFESDALGDTHIVTGTAMGINYGDSTEMEVGTVFRLGAFWNSRALLDFHVSSAIPAGASVKEATLRIYVTRTNGSFPLEVRIGWLKGYWDESSVTFLTVPDASYYTDQSYLVSAGTGYRYFDVTRQVQRMADWYYDYGFIIVSTSEGDTTQQLFIAATEYSNTLRTLLTVKWVP